MVPFSETAAWCRPVLIRKRMRWTSINIIFSASDQVLGMLIHLCIKSISFYLDLLPSTWHFATQLKSLLPLVRKHASLGSDQIIYSTRAADITGISGI